MKKIGSNDLKFIISDDTSSLPLTSNRDFEDGTKSISQRQISERSLRDAHETAPKGDNLSFKVFQNSEMGKAGHSKPIKATDHFEMKEDELKPYSERGASSDRSQNLNRDNIEDVIKFAFEERVKHKDGNESGNQNSARLLPEISPRLIKASDQQLQSKSNPLTKSPELPKESKDADKSEKESVKDLISQGLRQYEDKSEGMTSKSLTDLSNNASKMKYFLTLLIDPIIF